MMNMQTRNQYLQTLLQKSGGYNLLSKKEKSKILDEYCKNTGQEKKYVIRKIKEGKFIEDGSKSVQRKRESFYDGDVVVALKKTWKIFDYPCGQRLTALLKTEVERLIGFGELKCSDEVILKLKKMTPKTIDRKLKKTKIEEHLKSKYAIKKNPMLYQKIPVKTSGELDRSQHGNIQLDCVEHCGQSASGEFINTLSAVDISTSWWEGEACMGRGQRNVFAGIKNTRLRFPFNWFGIHPDNGTEFLNWHLYEYSLKENLEFSRSRPSKKNDNCFIEQKNWTHVRKMVGYLRYDTLEEQEILNDIYRNELRLFKNFFQPVMHLISKERVGGKIHRKYSEAKTPYQRILESEKISKEKKEELKKIYESLNPAEVKRNLDKKLDLLCKTYKKKQEVKSTDENIDLKVGKLKKLTPVLVTYLKPKSKRISVT